MTIPPLPSSPNNVFTVSPYIQGVVDIRFDDPSLNPKNQGLDIIGCNIYRSYNSEDGDYVKINSGLVSSLIYRDAQSDVQVLDEVIQPQSIERGRGANNDWVVNVQNYICVPGKLGTPSYSSKDVLVEIDDVPVPVMKVSGDQKEIYLFNAPWYDPSTQKLVEPVLPKLSSSVKVTYTANVNPLQTSSFRRLYYKVTSVDVNLNETPLEDAPSVVFGNSDTMDYQWREAVRRNNWILQQGGERVKLYVRKWFGSRHTCVDAWEEQPNHGYGAMSDCPICFGTGFVGGYEGPFDIIIAPRQASNEVSLRPDGNRQMNMEDVWTTSHPVISQRDFLIRANNDRYGLGPVTSIEVRGIRLQQGFSISMLPAKDIRYSVGLDVLPYQQPYITNKESVPAEIQERGRSRVFENISY